MRRTCFWLAPLLLAGFAAASLAQDPPQEPQPEPHLVFGGFGESLSGWSDDGALAVGTVSTRSTLWDLDAGMSLAGFPRYQRSWAVGVSPDFRVFATATSRHAVSLWNRVGRMLATLEHDGPTELLSWSPAGDALAVVNGGHATIWEAPTGRRRADVPTNADIRNPARGVVGHAPGRIGVPELAWRADGERLATATEAAVFVWDLDGNEQWRFPLPDPPQAIRQLAWSPDGRLLAGCGTVAYLWDGATGRVIGEYPVDVRVGELTPALLAAGPRVIGWDEVPALVEQPLRMGQLPGWRLGREFISVSWSPSSERVIFFSESGVPVLVGADGRPRGALLGGSSLLRWHEDGRAIVTLRRDTIVWWEVEPPAARRVVRLVDSAGRPAAAWEADDPVHPAGTLVREPLSPNGLLAVFPSAGRLRPEGHGWARVQELIFYDTGSGEVRARLDRSNMPEMAEVDYDYFSLLHWSPAGDRVLINRLGARIFWDVAQQRPVSIGVVSGSLAYRRDWAPDGSIRVGPDGVEPPPRGGGGQPPPPVADDPSRGDVWSPDRRYYVARRADRRQPLALHDGVTGERRFILYEGVHGRRVAWSPDGRWLVVHGIPNQVQVWDPRREEPVLDLDRARAHGWHPRENLLLQTRLDTGRWSALLWDVDNERESEFDIDFAPPWTPHWSPDGRWVLVMHERLLLIDVAERRVVPTPQAHDARLSAGAWHPDGERLATLGEDGTGAIWSLPELAVTTRFGGVESPVHQRPTWSPDGRRLLAIGNGLQHMFDAETGERLATFYTYHDDWLVFTPEGYFAAGGNGAELLRWRVGDEILPLERFRERFEDPERVRRVLAGR